MGLSMGHLLIVLLIVLLLFGTKRLGTMGRDLGSAMKGFRDAVREGKGEAAAKPAVEHHETNRLEGKVESKDKQKV